MYIAQYIDILGMHDYSKELIAASTIPIVLYILEEGDSYGYAIIRKVQDISDGALHWKEGSLYPVLAKLEKKKLITSYTKLENGRKRKYYRIRSDGLKFSAALRAEWESMNHILTNLWSLQNDLTWNAK